MKKKPRSLESYILHEDHTIKFPNTERNFFLIATFVITVSAIGAFLLHWG